MAVGVTRMPDQTGSDGLKNAGSELADVLRRRRATLEAAERAEAEDAANICVTEGKTHRLDFEKKSGSRQHAVTADNVTASIETKTVAKILTEATEAKQAKEASDARQARQAKEAKQAKEASDARQAKEAKQAKEASDARQAKEAKQWKDAKELREAAEAKKAEARAAAAAEAAEASRLTRLRSFEAKVVSCRLRKLFVAWLDTVRIKDANGIANRVEAALFVRDLFRGTPSPHLTPRRKSAEMAKRSRTPPATGLASRNSTGNPPRPNVLLEKRSPTLWERCERARTPESRFTPQKGDVDESSISIASTGIQSLSSLSALPDKQDELFAAEPPKVNVSNGKSKEFSWICQTPPQVRRSLPGEEVVGSEIRDSILASPPASEVPSTQFSRRASGTGLSSPRDDAEYSGVADTTVNEAPRRVGVLYGVGASSVNLLSKTAQSPGVVLTRADLPALPTSAPLLSCSPPARAPMMTPYSPNSSMPWSARLTHSMLTPLSSPGGGNVRQKSMPPQSPSGTRSIPVPVQIEVVRRKSGQT
eukprot:TRINITY_DN1522_c0_g1_i1.p1 TRINITY_DN1522_c0_g1~~TRINITY_DN1522_c0_g1_i1.p1  ORF type:complete len:557 (-),score=104.81 TRINITY_DN1522_c0_g1_i1:318-1922(-)